MVKWYSSLKNYFGPRLDRRNRRRWNALRWLRLWRLSPCLDNRPVHCVPHHRTPDVILRRRLRRYVYDRIILPFNLYDLLDDDKLLDKSDASVQDLGKIILTVDETTITGSTPFYNLAKGQDEILDERKVKMTTHKIQYVNLRTSLCFPFQPVASWCRLGEESVVSSRQTWYSSKHVRRLATFVFKYQPMGHSSKLLFARISSS